MSPYGIALSLTVLSWILSGPVLALEGKVLNVIDGDTYEIALPTGNERVRCLLIDTPEIHHPKRPAEELGEEAKLAAQKALLGKTVYLQVPDPPRDRYNRLLAHVFYSDRSGNKRLISANLCALGLALPLPMGDLTHFEDVEASVAWAASKGIGLWAKGKRRVFTPEQAAWEALLIRGYFIEVPMTVKSVRKTQKLWTITAREGRIKVYVRAAAAGSMDQRLFDEGRRIRVIGKIITDRGGIGIDVGSASQIGFQSED